MAKTSFNKKDIEKKKAEKRKLKQQRKEDKKTSGRSSLDDMIAYVDENGNITSTPPEEQQKKEVINAEDIMISIPKKEEQEEPSCYEGRVEHYNASKGFGFIKDIHSTEKYFFHISNTSADLVEGSLVEFELEKGRKGMNAINIILKNN